MRDCIGILYKDEIKIENKVGDIIHMEGFGTSITENPPDSAGVTHEIKNYKTGYFKLKSIASSIDFDFYAHTTLILVWNYELIESMSKIYIECDFERPSINELVVYPFKMHIEEIEIDLELEKSLKKQVANIIRLESCGL